MRYNFWVALGLLGLVLTGGGCSQIVDLGNGLIVETGRILKGEDTHREYYTVTVWDPFPRFSKIRIPESDKPQRVSFRVWNDHHIAHPLRNSRLQVLANGRVLKTVSVRTRDIEELYFEFSGQGWGSAGGKDVVVEVPPGTTEITLQHTIGDWWCWMEFSDVALNTPEKEPEVVVTPAPRKDAGLPVGQRWAVVIGISDYARETKRISDLKYAHRDAEKLAEFLKSKAGGGFPGANVKLLTDRQATAREIRNGLFTFLKKTVKEDLIVIFFSGHGMPDPDKPSNLYLVAHDSDPNNISATGIPMWDIETALKRTIAAERVIVLADTCHSAGVTEGVKGVKIGDQFNRYFEQLAKAKPGRVIFTSSEGYEVSREGKKWGGGHGVFTWALLDALKGKADRDKNGIVTLGEMLDYVDITVRRETSNEQHPARTGVRFDRNLPMGVVK